MPHVPILEPNHTSKDVFQVYEDFFRRMSFPAAPNFIKTQGHSLATIRGTWGLVSNVLVAGEIPRWTKEVIFVAISHDRGCRYCEAAHMACCRMLGVKPDLLNGIVDGLTAVPDKKLQAMVGFALKCSRDPQALTEKDYQSLRDVGLKQSEIVELIAMSGLAVYANIMADATRMEADEMFATVGGGRTPFAGTNSG